MDQKEILIQSTLDGTLQPSLFYKAKGCQRPLLVGLHTWSFNRFNQIKNMLPYAEKYDFNLLLPEFRGANTVTFDGGHQIDMEAAMYWILSQYKSQAKINVTG